MPSVKSRRANKFSSPSVKRMVAGSKTVAVSRRTSQTYKSATHFHGTHVPSGVPTIRDAGYAKSESSRDELIKTMCHRMNDAQEKVKLILEKIGQECS